MQWLTHLFGWLIKPITEIPAPRRRRILFWTGQVLLVLVAILLLGAINHYAGLDRVLRTRWLGLQHVWLPLLFLLGYLLFWLLRWLWLLLGPEREAGEFDDIEAAWTLARAELDRAGIGLSEVPVFLILGRPEGTMEQVFAATRMPFQVRHAPRDGTHPLHVYASREAIFVTCEGASLLAAQTDRLLEVEEQPPTPEPEPWPDPAADLTEQLAASLPALPAPPALPALPEPIPTRESGPTEPQPSGAVLLLGEPEGTTLPGKPRRAPLLRDTAAVDLHARRLRHVCRVLVRDRRPYCPVNGILVLLPLAATDSREDAAETAAVLRHDLELTRQALQLDCPRFAVLCDAEEIPGFRELTRHFRESAGGPSRLLGQHFPLVPDVGPGEVPRLIEAGLSHVGDSMLPQVVARLLRREGDAGVATRAQALEANIHLYEFTADCRERLLRFARMLANAFQNEDAPSLLGGAYLAGTGPDGERDQAFLAGVFRRLLEHQNAVRWTRDALAEDADYHRYALLGYLALALFISVVVWTLLSW